MRANICSRVCAVIGRPHCGQWPVTHPGEQHPQIIVNLGDRANRRARALPAGLLRNRNSRIQPADQIHVGLGHLAKKLPRKTRQTLHVTPLPLGIKRVERQRTLARSADPRETDQLVPGQLQIDITQVVLSGTANEDIGSGHETEFVVMQVGLWRGRLPTSLDKNRPVKVPCWQRIRIAKANH